MALIKGKLIVFEGNDQVGKSTIIKHIEHDLISKGKRVKCYHFPGKNSSRLGELVNAIHHKDEFLSKYHLKIPPIVLQMLHVSAHIDLEMTCIIPDLSEGAIVLLDRSWISTLAYGCAHGISEDEITSLVNIERKYLPETQVDALFYIQREEDEKSEYRDEILRYYDYFITKYFRPEIFHRITNNDDFDSTLRQVIIHINELVCNEK